MKRPLCILCFLLTGIFFIQGCQNHTHFKGVTVAERISSQQDSSVIIIPSSQPTPPPQYPWRPKYSQVITKHSFYCRGNSEISKKPPFQDCKGLFSHDLPIKNGKEYIHPNIIRSSAILCKLFPQEEFTVLIHEGFACKRHFLFKQAIGQPLHPKHLTGEAAIIHITSHQKNLPVAFFIEKILPALQNLYTKKCYTEYSYQVSQSQIINKELSLSFSPINNGVKIFIETLDNSYPSKQTIQTH